MTSRATASAAVAMALLFGWIALVSGPARRRVNDMNAESMTSPAAGISRALAARRGRAIDGLAYALRLHLPADVSEPVRGTVVVELDWSPDPPPNRDGPGSGASTPLVLDFAGAVDAVRVGNRPVPFIADGSHLLVGDGYLRRGANVVTVDFQADGLPLNRHPDYLYSLFVPARAHLVFPCFDQPDLKARFTLTLDLPSSWAAVSNGAEASRQTRGGRTVVRFARTRPLPTYLFGFAAGRFTIETETRGNRTLRLFHREDDADRLTRNRATLFDRQAAALDWMETYTGIPYPFEKFDFLAIPDFQFSGMEHPGAILYNASTLLLDESATQDRQLARSSTIAHETAHMWFGDLVTMRWFDDVWMKEVFANFLAAKIVNPAFPDLNHDLRFLMAHHPAAYAIDRTRASTPIRQPLDNLRNAGTLYGPIIYQKAPIVMRQLERLLGETELRLGLQEYLRRFAFANATWPDLIAILDGRTTTDLVAWSRAWIEERGRPVVRASFVADATGAAAVQVVQDDPLGRGLQWPQQFRILLGPPDSGRRAGDTDTVLDVTLTGATTTVPVGAPGSEGTHPDFLLPNVGGLGYGRFELDAASRGALVATLPALRDPLVRGAAWLALWDELLEDRLDAAVLFDAGLRLLPRETAELNVQRVLDDLSVTYWRFLSGEARRRAAPALESTLWDGITRAPETSLKATYLAALEGIALTPGTVGRLEAIWRHDAAIADLPLSEIDESRLAVQLAVREVPAWAEILETQYRRIENADRRARFAFLMPAASADPAVRAAFFAALAEVGNRRQEPWVLDGLRLLHHPLRANTALPYVRPGLDLLEEVQRTGDVFFPGRWLDATLEGHRSPAAADIVSRFLADRPDYPEHLRRLVEQSADMLLKASRQSE